MTEQPPKSLKTNDGQVRVDHKAITAEGKERNRILTTQICGCAFILLVLAYVYTLIFGKEGHELLAFIGTAFGLFIGRASSHGD